MNHKIPAIPGKIPESLSYWIDVRVIRLNCVGKYLLVGVICSPIIYRTIGHMFLFYNNVIISYSLTTPTIPILLHQYDNKYLILWQIYIWCGYVCKNAHKIPIVFVYRLTHKYAQFLVVSSTNPNHIKIRSYLMYSIPLLLLLAP